MEIFCQKRQDREVFWAAVGIFLCLLAMTLCGCAAQKPIMNAPPRPHEAACGVPVVYEFEDKHQETWVYPCWPESKQKKPYCVKGCKTELVCHADGNYREATPTGAFLWKYTRIQRVFGVECERKP